MKKEFFEAFGIEPTIKWLGNNFSSGKQWFTYEIRDKFGNINETKKFYPPITPEIVLGLEEIIRQNNKIKLELIFGSEFVYRYELIREYGSIHNRISHKSRKDALLKLCIQLKHELQSEVQQLFRKG